VSDADADLAFAQQVVVEYARTLARDISENRLPGRVDSPQFPKTAIKEEAIEQLTRDQELAALAADQRTRARSRHLLPMAGAHDRAADLEATA
jgi:hypothetical protein